MNDLTSQFASITQLFYTGQFQQGRNMLNHLIHLSPDNSILLANRALFSSQLGQDLLAIEDLEKAIELQPFNYLAYFNLFSILTRNNEDWQAYNNLCCCLSCMYLLKAKSQRSIALAEKSLYFAGNNTAARLLKIGLLQQAKLSEKAAAQLKMLTAGTSLAQDSSLSLANLAPLLDSLNQSKQRLHNSIVFPSEGDLIEEINERVREFNAIYSELNHNMGTITQRVPKESHLSNNIEAFMKSKISSNKESVIAILEDQDYFNAPNKKSQARYHTIDTNPESMEEILLPFPEEEPTHPSYHFSTDKFGSKDQAQSIIQQKSMEYEDSRSETIKKQPSPHLSTQFIYPISGNMQLKINLLHFKFLQPPQTSYRHVYCLISYSDQPTLRSCTTQCQDECCTWDESFPAIALSPQPCIMKLSIHNKQLSSMRDSYIGEIQVIIDLADLLNLPIYSKQGEPVGQLLLHLELVPRVSSVQ